MIQKHCRNKIFTFISLINLFLAFSISGCGNSDKSKLENSPSPADSNDSKQEHSETETKAEDQGGAPAEKRPLIALTGSWQLEEVTPSVEKQNLEPIQWLSKNFQYIQFEILPNSQKVSISKNTDCTVSIPLVYLPEQTQCGCSYAELKLDLSKITESVPGCGQIEFGASFETKMDLNFSQKFLVLRKENNLILKTNRGLPDSVSFILAELK